MFMVFIDGELHLFTKESEAFRFALSAARKGRNVTIRHHGETLLET